MQEKSFDLRTLGKPDYSQAHAIVASIPENTRCQMRGIESELLARLLHIAWVFAAKSGRGAAYCWPTLATLARYTRRSVRTVERHMRTLKDLGLIQWIRRKNANGGWTSNLYTMGRVLLASLYARTGKKVKQFRDTTKTSTNDLKREYKADAPAVTGGRLTDFLENLRRNRPACPDGAPVASA